MANIISLSRAAREIAKKWFFARKLALWFTLAFALVAVFLYLLPKIGLVEEKTLPKVELILTIIAFLSQLFGILCLFRGLHLHRLAREGFRRGILLDSSGISSEPLYMAYLTQRFPIRLEEKAQLFGNNYYSSTKELGLPRLIENLQENAFFTGNLFRLAAWRALWWLVIPALIVLILSFVLPFIRGTESFSVSRALLTIMVFFCASGSITECVTLFSASSKALEVGQRLESIDISSNDAIIAVFADYYVATEIAPTISTGLYEKNKERLKKEWDMRTKKI